MKAHKVVLEDEEEEVYSAGGEAEDEAEAEEGAASEESTEDEVPIAQRAKLTSTVSKSLLQQYGKPQGASAPLQDDDKLVVYIDANDFRWVVVLMRKSETGEEPCSGNVQQANLDIVQTSINGIRFQKQERQILPTQVILLWKRFIKLNYHKDSRKYPQLWALKGANPIDVRRWYGFGTLASISTIAPGFQEISELPNWVLNAVYES
ncbi:hypothetical protein ACS0TY_010558 [Phlomoides rotata]